jgi:UDP-glucose 4-epimerase
MKILVTGAAGYIGSVVTEQLVEFGHHVVALDDLRHGHKEAVHPGADFRRGDLLDRNWIASVFRASRPDAVVHMAAEALIDESLRDPGRFFAVNVTGGLNLLDAMVATGVSQIVFSSTAAVYGEPATVPVLEDAPCAPVNAYGESKLAFERMLKWYQIAHRIRYVTLRYFNACGASERYGEFHTPETHLIPLLFEAALGRRESLQLYGIDYDTPDGTCIRDYIHVSDIAHAHVLALSRPDLAAADVFNLGNGSGYSNREVIEAVREVTGRDIPIAVAARRPGDPARLVASSQRIAEVLGWKARYSTLETMIDTAWAWRIHHPNGLHS